MKNSQKIHTNFSINGKKFVSKIALLAHAKTISRELFTFLNQWFYETETVMVKTSGSTGKPKSIKIKKEFMVNSALATGTFFNLKEGTTALLCLSPNYIAGKMMMVRALTLGWQLDVVKPNSNPLKGNNKTYDFCAMVPMQVQNSLHKLNQIKILIVGGAAVSNTLKNSLQYLNTKVFETYGMTETITHIAVKPLNNCLTNNYFKTLPQVNISKDKRDCLVIEAPKISDNKIVTNDLVKIVTKKQFKWLGRIDNIINTGGVKIIPEEVEQKLSKILPFRFFIAGLPDKLLGEKVVLLCEGKPIKIDESFNDKLTKFEKPREILFCKKFIETTTQKINRKETLKLVTSC